MIVGAPYGRVAEPADPGEAEEVDADAWEVAAGSPAFTQHFLAAQALSRRLVYQQTFKRT